MVEIEEAERNIGISTSSTTQCSIVDSIQQILDSEGPSSTTQCSIYRVHEKLRRINEFAYKPELVSIGPFHYEQLKNTSYIMLEHYFRQWESLKIVVMKKLHLIVLPCAIELKRSGVKFVKGKGNSILDIKFKDGILEIPPLVIDDNTDTLLRNLIAFEQQVNGVDNYISSFAYMMDGLINTTEDVKIFRKAGITDNMLGSDEDVAVLFNKLCYGINIAKWHYSELYNELNTYYKAPRNQGISMMKRFICGCSFSACA
ncbi:hypothetical protein C5167_002441 [Papaver somniferum]|uniref:Uncharacterized protein n=1 Tax=Papaver somniferum TaxID=3469 RepID=A0A4Y7KY52_PAPSO|nr:hypothetical protein C5167_002441 [Papaver somniferum]